MNGNRKTLNTTPESQMARAGDGVGVYPGSGVGLRSPLHTGYGCVACVLVRPLAVGVGVSDPPRPVLLLLLGRITQPRYRVCAWSYRNLLCLIWLISLECPLFSEEQEWI